jgi:hypothetical protein
MAEKSTNKAELLNLADRRKMMIINYIPLLICALLIYKYDLYLPFSIDNPFLFFVSIAWFSMSAVETFNKRMGQIEMQGEQPPYMEYKGLHVPMLIIRYGTIICLAYLDWRWALTLYIVTIAFAVSPILENIGRILMFLWLKRYIPTE